VSKFDPGKEAIQKVANIVVYAMIISIFFVVLEIFTAFGICMVSCTLLSVFMGMQI
jgi:uncharacterized membrane protein